MTLFIWRILACVSAVFFVILTALLLSLRLLRNGYYHAFEDDELIKQAHSDNSENAIYFTSGPTRKYIKKYVLCSTAFDRYMVCNFARSFANITYFVVQYNKRKRVKKVLRISESNTGDESKVIALHRACARVDVIVAEVDGVVLNTDVIRPLSLVRIRLQSFLKSFALFLGLFVVRHAILELALEPEMLAVYVNHLFNYAAIGGSFVFAAIGYLIATQCLRGKNAGSLNGGVLEYDFL